MDEQLELASEEQVTVAPTPAAVPEAFAPVRITQTPFLAYLGVWVVFIVASVALLLEAARSGGVLFSPRYVYSVYGGATLAAAGPVLSLVVWFVTRAHRTVQGRKGLLAAALLSGASVTFVGTALWIVALFVLDLYHAGVFS